MSVLVTMLLASLAVVRGKEPQQVVDWYAVGEACPSSAAVLDATTGYLGRELDAYPLELVAQARVEASAGAYRMRLSIEVEGLEQRHELSGIDCDQLADDAALLIATAVDPFVFGPEPGRPAARELLERGPRVVQRARTRASPNREPTQETPRVQPEQAPGPELEPFGPLYPADIGFPRDPESSRIPIEGVLGVSGTSFVGLFPQLGGGVELEGGLERGLLRWQLGAAGWFGGSFRASGGDIGGDLWGVSGSTSLCAVPHQRRVRFLLCAAAGAGAMTATSVNTINQRRATRPWVYAGGDLRVAWTPRPRLGIFVGLSVLPALVRPSWSVSNPDAIETTPPVAGLLRLGFELRGLRRQAS